MREKGRTWASDESESHVLMGRVFQYLEERGFSGAFPEKGVYPASKCLGSGQEYKPGAGVGHARGGEAPPRYPGHRCWTSASHHPAKYL